MLSFKNQINSISPMPKAGQETTASFAANAHSASTAPKKKDKELSHEELLSKLANQVKLPSLGEAQTPSPKIGTHASKVIADRNNNTPGGKGNERG